MFINYLQNMPYNNMIKTAAISQCNYSTFVESQNTNR